MPHRNQHYLFVYGTLRRGETNDITALSPEAVFITRAFVRGRLYDHGTCPAMALDTLASWITGELYKIPGQAVEKIDMLEHDQGGFRRTQALVHDAAGDAWPCWIYLPAKVPTHRHSIVPGGDWVRYRKLREQRTAAAAVPPAFALGTS